MPWWARAADVLVVALLVLALFVALKGGFVVSLAGFRISMRSEWRVFLWAGILLLVRHVLVRDEPLHRRATTGIWKLACAAGPLPDDDGVVIPHDGRARAPKKRLLSLLLWGTGVIALFALLTAAMTYPQARFMSSMVSVNEGDPLFSTWRLAWVAHQLPRDPLNLFDANIFHPEPGTLAFSDAMIVPALTTAPLLWLGVPQLVAYNLSLLSGFALSGAAMFLLVRSLTGNSGAALLAGFIFAFLPYRFMHYAHLELQMAQWMPLCLWAFHRTVTQGRVRDGLLTGLFLALQTLSSWYYGIFLCTFMAPVGVALLVGEGASRAKAAIRPLACGAVLAAALIIPMALPYFAARANVGERPESEIKFYSATPRNYLAAHPQNVLFGSHTAKLGGQERELFMGFIVPLIALVGLWPPLSAARIAYALGLILAFDVSLGFNGMLYPLLHEYVLPYRGLRVPARMAVLVGFGLAILAGYGAARLAKMARSPKASGALLLGLGLAVCSEYYSVPQLKKVWTSPSPIYDALPPHSASVLLEMPLLAPDISLEPVYMYFSTFHWNALVNGYSGFSPPSYERLHASMEHFPDAVSFAELRRRGVTHIVIHGALYLRPNDYERAVGELDRCSELQLVTDVPWERRRTRLYRLLPASQPGD